MDTQNPDTVKIWTLDLVDHSKTKKLYVWYLDYGLKSKHLSTEWLWAIHVTEGSDFEWRIVWQAGHSYAN